jgi:hypothetical protein
MVSHEHRCRRNSARNADFTAPKTPSSPQRLVPVWRVESGLPRWSTGVTASWLHHSLRTRKAWDQQVSQRCARMETWE